MSGAWLILPTYDEAENIEAIVAAALPQLASTGLEHRILVVDDKSPDGTGADRRRARRRATRASRCCTAPARTGIGPAYLAGFARALAGGADYVLEMDSDFSHDPADLPRLIARRAARRPRARLALRPGRRRHRLGPAARASSAAAGRSTRKLILGIAGQRPDRRLQVLPPHGRSRRLDLDGVSADGYGFQIEMTYRAIQAGFTVEEVPILFRDRRVGSSKMSAKIAVEAFWKVPLLRFRAR